MTVLGYIIVHIAIQKNDGAAFIRSMHNSKMYVFLHHELSGTEQHLGTVPQASSHPRIPSSVARLEGEQSSKVKVDTHCAVRCARVFIAPIAAEKVVGGQLTASRWLTQRQAFVVT